jgi:Zn-dependent M28 family amino/carboxypeptidase
VANSPGINAGSGAATNLAIALALSSLSYQPTNKLVFAWWGAKEAGDAGISHYLNSLSEEQINNTAVNINLDIVGSQNYIPYVSSILWGKAIFRLTRQPNIQILNIFPCPDSPHQSRLRTSS